MKKILVMLLSVLLVVSSIGMTVYASDFEPGYNDDELDWADHMGMIEVGDATVNVGEEFTIPVSITKNPGAVSVKLLVSYDTKVLELVKAEGGVFGVESADPEVAGTLSFGDVTEAPFQINWLDYETHENVTTTGILANLTFKVKDTATAGSSKITLSYDPDDLFDVDLLPLEFNTKDGTITIKTYTPGDINGDGSINMKDVTTLQRHLAHWDGIEIEEAALDCNGDGSINMKDVTHLQRYLAHWDGVELH